MAIWHLETLKEHRKNGLGFFPRGNHLPFPRSGKIENQANLMHGGGRNPNPKKQ